MSHFSRQEGWEVSTQRSEHDEWEVSILKVIKPEKIDRWYSNYDHTTTTSVPFENEQVPK